MDSSPRHVSATVYLALTCLSAVLLGGCSTIGRGEAYEGSEDSAYLFLAASGIGGTLSSAGFTFRRFDVERQTFAPEYFFVSFEGIAGNFSKSRARSKRICGSAARP